MNRLGENFHGRKFIGTKFIVAKIIHERFSVEKKKAPSTLVPRQGGEARSLNFIQPSSTTRVHREATQISFENRAACELARFGERETTKARTIINASNQAGVGGARWGRRLFLAPAHVKDITYPPFLPPLFISVVAGYRRMVPRCPEIRETFGSRRLPPPSPPPPAIRFLSTEPDRSRK